MKTTTQPTKPNAFADIAGLFVLLCAAITLIALASYLTGCSSTAPAESPEEIEARCAAAYAGMQSFEEAHGIDAICAPDGGSGSAQ